METLTDHKCRSKRKILYDRICDEYEVADVTVDDQFHLKMMDIDRVLSEALKVRPIGTMEIDRACKTALDGFRSALREQRARNHPAESRA